MKPSIYDSCCMCPFYIPFGSSTEGWVEPCLRELHGNSIAVKSEPINYSSTYIKENLIIPVLSGSIGQGVLSIMNTNFKNDVMEFKSQMEESAKENGEEAKRHGRPVIPYVVSTSYDLSFNKNNAISLSIIYKEILNNVTSYIRVPYNYELSKGRPLSIKDIFISGVNYKDSINKKILTRLRANPKAYAPYNDKNFKGIVDVQPYYLDGNNLVVFLGLSGIGSSLDKIPAVKIPLSEFGNELRPEFKP